MPKPTEISAAPIPYENMTTEDKLAVALTIKSPSAFFVSYFKLLPYFTTMKACFNYLNDIHCDVYDTPKYSSFQSFRNCMYRDGQKYLKNKS